MDRASSLRASLRLNNNTPEMARAEMRKMAAMGIKFTGEIALTPIPGPSEKELEILRAVVDEAKKVGVMVQVHAVSSKAMVAAVDAGVPLLVHLPNKDWVSKEDAKKVAAAGVKVLGTVSFGSPVFGVFADDNKPRFRDGKAVAGRDRRRGPPGRGSRIYAGECAYDLGCRRQPRLLHRHNLRSRRPGWIMN